MKSVYIGVATALIMSFILMTFVGGLVFYEYYSTEQSIHNYYNDLIKGDYNSAVDHLHLWQEKPEEPLSISKTEARDLLVKKITSLKKLGYQVQKVDKIEVKSEGSRMGALVSLDIKINGTTRHISEKINYFDAKIVVTESQDPFYSYRSGKVGP